MFRLAVIHLRRYIKNPLMMIMMLPLPLGLILSSVSFGHSEDNRPPVAIVLQESGMYETKLIEALELPEEFVFVEDDTLAISMLVANDLAGIIKLPGDFSQNIENGVKPIVSVIKTSEGAGTFWAENLIEEQTKTWLKESYGLDTTTTINTVVETIEEGQDITLIMFVVMVIYFMFIGATALAKDVGMLKQQRVLSRALSTANKNYQILGGLIIAMCLIEGILFSIVYYIGVMLLDVSISNIFEPLLLVFSMAFVASSFVVFATRIIKNQSMVEMAIVAYALFGFLLCLLTMNMLQIDLNIAWLESVAKLFPMYWAFDTAFNSTLWPNIPIILLFGLLFLTAGSLKLNRFVKN
ncbi:MAG: ABC transporter permease [Turicibacter sp.]